MQKQYRVKDEKEFQKVYEQGKSSANRNFIVYVLPKKDQKHFRIGISCGKRIGNAVTRNRVKRKIRQGIFEIQHQIKNDYDFIVIARPSAVGLTLEETKKNLIHVLKIAKMINNIEREGDK